MLTYHEFFVASAPLSLAGYVASIPEGRMWGGGGETVVYVAYVASTVSMQAPTNQKSRLDPNNLGMHSKYTLPV